MWGLGKFLPAWLEELGFRVSGFSLVRFRYFGFVRFSKV